MPIRAPRKSSNPGGVKSAKSLEKANEPLPVTKQLLLPTAWGLPPVPVQNSFSSAPTVNPRALEGLNGTKHVPGPYDAQVQVSVDAFTDRVRVILNHDAMALARGSVPVKEGDALTADQEKQLKDAAVDFIEDLPAGALMPQLTAGLQKKLTAAHLKVRDISSTKLKDMGDVGSDLANDLINGLKAKSPAAFYSLAASAAAAAGYLAWNGGSAQLQKLGITPQVKQHLFSGHLGLNVKAQWEPHFKEFKADGTIDGKIPLGKSGGELTASVTANSKTGFDAAAIGYSIEKKSWNLSSTANFDRTGFVSSRIDARFHSPGIDATAYATFAHSGVQHLGATFAYNPNPKFSLSSSIDYSAAESKASASTEISYKPQKNMSFALSARGDTKGGAWVGVGARITF